MIFNVNMNPKWLKFVKIPFVYLFFYPFLHVTLHWIENI